MPVIVLAVLAYCFHDWIHPINFFLFGVLVFLTDTLMFVRGYDGWLWKHLTVNELEAQRKKLGLDK